MKNTNLMVLAVFLLGFVISGCKKSEPAPAGDQAKQYTCVHHPEIVQDKPGNCPKCEMKLVEKK